MGGLLDTADEIRRHVGVKLAAYEIRPEVAERMLAALDSGADPDYAALFHAATHPEPPARVYHTAPRSARESILRRGLEASQPGRGGSWAPYREVCVRLQAAQPPGVYVAAQPDRRGVWAHWPEWDVWEVDLAGLLWAHDALNPGCWSVPASIPPDCIRLAWPVEEPALRMLDRDARSD